MCLTQIFWFWEESQWKTFKTAEYLISWTLPHLESFLKTPIRINYFFSILIFTDGYVQRDIILTTKRVNERNTHAVCRSKSILDIPTLIQGKIAHFSI